jgi:hypothetical protein
MTISMPKPMKETTPIRISNLKESKKKPFTQKEMDEIAQSMEKLSITNEKALFNEFIGSQFENESLARSLGSYLVQYAIEEHKAHGRQVAKICASLLECPAGSAFHSGLVTGVMQYFECRDQLRFDHVKVWTNFLSFVSDLYSNIGSTYEGIFFIFNTGCIKNRNWAIFSCFFNLKLFKNDPIGAIFVSWCQRLEKNQRFMVRVRRFEGKMAVFNKNMVVNVQKER